MSDLVLTIGNKNYSSWSMRPWVAMRHAGIPFTEVVVPLDQPGTAAAILARSPSGRVPALLRGALTIWDSLAILEHLAESFPKARLWPAAGDARAVARSVSAEMHSGFAALREQLPLNVRASCPDVLPSARAAADIARIVGVWNDCRARFGTDGPFLFGEFSIADAMYAPVVSRFVTYAVPLDGAAREYADMMWALPAVVAWAEGARAEHFEIARYERRGP